MRSFSSTEKKILKSVSKVSSNEVSLIHFINPGWQNGYYEVSGFQQKIQVFLEDDKKLSGIMQYLREVLDLVRYLEQNDYISTWNYIPLEDNSQYCGVKTETSEPYFLSDISIASEFLQICNNRIIVKESLRKLVKWNYKSIAERKLDRNMRIGIISFIVIILLGVSTSYFNFKILNDGIRVSIDQLDKTSRNSVNLQFRNKELLDSLQSTYIIMDSIYESMDISQIKIDKIHREISSQKTLLYTIQQNQKMIENNMNSIQSKLNRLDSTLQND